MRRFYHLICDRCRKTIVDELKDSSADRRRMLGEGRGIAERTKKGNILHFCSEDCCRRHRGPRAGQGRLPYI